MREYSTKKSSFSQFESPFEKYNNPRTNHGDFGLNFNKLLSSWFYVRDFISLQSVAEVERLRDVFSTVFQINDKDGTRKRKKAKYVKTLKRSHILKIDLNKIEENLKLNKKEKRRLRRILNEIKCEDLCETKNNKEIKTRSGRTVVLRKDSTIAKDESFARSRKRHSSIDAKKSYYRQRRGGSEWKNCKLCSQIRMENKSFTKRKQRSPYTNTTPSEERIFKTLMSLDRSCCGDSFKTLFNPKKCPGLESTVFSRKHNINIENLELKYIKPTCVVHYNSGNNNISSVDLENHRTKRTRSTISSNFNPDSLFRTNSIQYNSNVKNGGIWEGNPVMENQRKSTISAKSSVSSYHTKNEFCRNFERKHSTTLVPNNKKTGVKTSEEFDIEKHLQSLKSYRDKMVSVEFEEGYENLEYSDKKLPIRHDAKELGKKRVNFRSNEVYEIYQGSSRCEERVRSEKKISKCKKFKNFAKRCFCIWGNKDGNNADRETRKRKADLDEKLRSRLNSPEIKIVRTTEQNFLERNKTRG